MRSMGRLKKATTTCENLISQSHPSQPWREKKWGASREGVGSKSRNVSRRSHSWGPSLTSVLMNGTRTKLPTRNTSKYQVMQKSQRQQPRNQRPHKSQAHGPEANPITVRYSTAARNKLTPIPHRRIQTLTDKAEHTPKTHSE